MQPHDLAELHRSLEVGRVEAILEALPGLDAGSPTAKTAAMALRGGLYLAGHPEGVLLRREDLPTPPNMASGYLRLLGTFQARLRGDIAALRQWAEAGTEPGDAVDVCATDLACAWRGLWEGDHVDIEALVQGESRARDAHLGDVAVDFAILQALHYLNIGESEEGLVHARRASRMGQTEHAPQSEYAAHIALARARRHNGLPHLAMRIMAGLSEVAPPVWHGWLALEMTMCGSTPPASMELSSSPAGLWAQQLRQVLPGPGQPDANHDGMRSVTAAAAGRPSWMRAEVYDALCCASLEGASGASDAARLWTEGVGTLPPHGLHGLTGEDIGYVRVVPGEPARRRLGPPPDSSTILLSGDNREARTERGLGALAFAEGHRLGVDAFFESVYGFAFDQGLHGSWLRTLLMRMRSACEGVATIEREGEALRLLPTKTFFVRDPRCVQSPAEQVLQLIAKDGAMGARQAAGKLGIPLRSVQRTLKTLVDEGVCQADRSSRKVVYKIEDTTFHEPTTSYRAQYKK